VLASRSFGRAVTNLDQVRDAVASHTARAAERMRRGNLATAEVVVFVHTSRFKASDEQYSASHLVRLPVATADTGKLIGAAMLALERIWRPGFRYAKAGVTFPQLVAATRV
jgi:DNA polymerase V